ncbi:flagellin [Sporosarcina ureae]|uniref:flagellin N-terminal helical domain-containing protein n=1 Tax=Sporosarcina ureae TaxID=1571 RepID=UPI000A17B2F8|nr:flagellin [Sporosarcina ureae]ARK22458.1 flagellin [Sporosarcina ureae]
MIINHNMAAMNTHRQLGSNNAAAANNIEKLSSGLKINRAGDDAAGLAISEKMRGQIRGLDMAQKNSQDGISLIQTAEGSLNETHDILQRMRELAVQAGNDTNVAGDREEIQKELNQLTSEINRIGNTTEFNQKKLINGDLSSKFEVTAAVTTPATKVDVTKAVEQTIKVGTEPIAWSSGSKADIDVTIGGTADNGFAWNNLDTGNEGSIAIKKSGDSFEVSYNGTDGASKSLDINADKVALDEATGTYSYNNQGISFSFSKEDAADWAEGGTVTIDLSKSASSGDATGTVNTVPKSVELASTGTAAPAATAVMGDITVAGGGANLANVDSLEIEWDEANNKFTAIQKAGADVVSTTEFSLESGDTLNFNQDGISFTFTGTTGTGATDAKFTGTFDLKTETNKVEVAGEVTTAAVTKDQSAQFQIGANEGQSMSVGIEDMRAVALGIATVGTVNDKLGVTNGTDNVVAEQALDVSSHEKAAAAVSTIQDAIDKVSSERSKLGASQNRLEHTINNLGTSSENLTSAESRIRDVDYVLAA